MHGLCAGLNFVASMAFFVASKTALRRLSVFKWSNTSTTVVCKMYAMAGMALWHAFGHFVLFAVHDPGQYFEFKGLRYAIAFVVLSPGPIIGLCLAKVPAAVCAFLYSFGVTAFSELINANNCFPVVSCWILAWYSYPGATYHVKTKKAFLKARSGASDFVASFCVALAAIASTVDIAACGDAFLYLGGHFAHDSVLICLSVVFSISELWWNP